MAIHGRFGNNRCARVDTSTSCVAPNKTSSTRGQMSLTPNTNQPLWISQNSSGAFSLYGSPLMYGTSQWPWLNISHATASVRVEYSGIGPCEKMANSATTVHNSNHDHMARRFSRRL